MKLQLIEEKWRTIPSMYGIAFIAGVQAAMLLMPRHVLDIISLWGMTVQDWGQVVTAIGAGVTAAMRVLKKPEEPENDEPSGTP